MLPLLWWGRCYVGCLVVCASAKRIIGWRWGGGVEQGEDILLLIIWEGEHLLDGVNRPSKDNFMCAPGDIAFAELLEGYWLFPFRVVLVVGSEEVVDG